MVDNNHFSEIEADQSEGSWEDLKQAECKELPKMKDDYLPKMAGHLPKMSTAKVPAPKIKSFTGSRAERLHQINEVAKTHRPRGRVVAILESGNRTKEQMCTLTTLHVEKTGKTNKKDDSVVVFAVASNPKMPWMHLVTLPAEYHSDL